MSRYKTPIRCYELPFLSCSIPQAEETCLNPHFACMAHYYASQPLAEQERIRNDAFEQGYSFEGPEDTIKRANFGRWVIRTTGGKEQSLNDLIGKQEIVHPLRPNTVAYDLSMNEQTDAIPHHHARGSQYRGSRDWLSVLLSNIDQEKLEEAAQRRVRVMSSTGAGSVRHRISEAPNLVHELPEYNGFDGEYYPREEYCEQRVAFRFSVEGLEDQLDQVAEFLKGGAKPDFPLWDMANFIAERKEYMEWFKTTGLDWRESNINEYCVKGTADMVLRFQGLPNIVLGDYKRSRYKANAFSLQMTAYALGIEQMSGLEPKPYYLISVLNRFHNKPGDYNPPVFAITMVEQDDILIQTLKLKTVLLHTFIRDVVEDPELFISFRDEQRLPDKKDRNGEPCSICDILFTGVPCINTTSQDTSCDMFYGAIKGDDNRPPVDPRTLLIDGFQLRA